MEMNATDVMTITRKMLYISFSTGYLVLKDTHPYALILSGWTKGDSFTPHSMWKELQLSLINYIDMYLTEVSIALSKNYKMHK